MPLVENLIQAGWLKTPRIIDAFKKIKRADFLPDDIRDLAEINEAMSIGHKQTISQPLVVAFMLELLQPEQGDKIMDIGFGSGWTTALLAEIVGEKGKVIAIELIPQLAEFGRKNIGKYNFTEKGIAQCFCADGSKGYGKEAPYDKILASATLAAAKGGKEDLSSLTAASNLPAAWKEQLKAGGRIVVPIGSSVWLFLKNNNSRLEEKEYPGFVFVPLISQQ